MTSSISESMISFAVRGRPWRAPSATRNSVGPVSRPRGLRCSHPETERASQHSVSANAPSISTAEVDRTFKELKSDMHLGQMHAAKDAQRVRRAILLPVMAYMLLVRLYGKELEPDQGGTIFQLNQRFSEGV